MVKLEMEVDGLPDWQTNMLNPDFAQVAEAMGMAGFNVSDPEEVLTTLLNAFELDGPVLVNIMTDPNALASLRKLYPVLMVVCRACRDKGRKVGPFHVIFTF